ncbi:MAG TPA: pantoate--beta-alanine ligase [Candidatus Cybelea sp.]|jgi:pantoate--beta-alanine ligase|nr:pantoate--beta-alanine ligase [Candidatus Cybelea sp.]
METVDTVTRARALFDAAPRPLGFVPTMGALHDGHLELIRRARLRCASVGASIFVNPLQFGPNEDFARYPRDEERDRVKLSQAGADMVFVPNGTTMYPVDFSTFVEVGPMGHLFEGAHRPDHFRGVTTVIAKLLNIARPDVLFLGQKDAQQAAVVCKMIAELNYPVEIEIVPTVRERDGLAMSSRNRYLDATQRAQAPTLYRALEATRDALERGVSKSEAIAEGTAALSASAKLDYLDLVDADSFVPLERLRPSAFIVAAARFGGTRLIDNLWITE